MRRSTSRASASAARAHLQEVVIGRQAHVHVDAARAGGLGKAEQAVLVEHLAHAERDLAHLRERHVGLGVEIDAQLVRMVEVGAAHRPRVPVDHAEVHAPHQMRRVVGHQLARVAAAGKGDGRRLQPLGRAVGHALLKERLALHAVHPALHHRRALAQAAHDRLGALDVVVDEIELGQLALREEQLAGVAHAQLVAADVDGGGLSLLGSHCWKDARSCSREHCSSPRAHSTNASARTTGRRGRRARAGRRRLAGRSVPDRRAGADRRSGERRARAARRARLRRAHAQRARADRLRTAPAGGHARGQRRV